MKHKPECLLNHCPHEKKSFSAGCPEPHPCTCGAEPKDQETHFVGDGCVPPHGIQSSAEPQALTDKWEERFDKKIPKLISDLTWTVTDGGRRIKPIEFLTYQDEPVREYEEIKSFIRAEIQAAYERGIKDSEGTKNGVKRYLLGYEDGKREATSSLKDRICAELKKMDLSFYKEQMFNEALSIRDEAIAIVRETE